MFRLVIDVDVNPRYFDLLDARCIVGRELSADLSVRDRLMSRKHFALERDEQGWTLTDMLSSSGTLVNGMRSATQRPHRLAEGDLIRAGGTTFRFERVPPLREDERTMLRALRSGDDALRVFVDVLESRGESRDAAYVRAALALREAPPADQEALRVALEQLTPGVAARTRALVARTSIERCGAGNCPREWTLLEPTPDARKRTCPVCTREVFFCDTLDEARLRPSTAVVIDPSRRREPNDLR